MTNRTNLNNSQILMDTGAELEYNPEHAIMDDEGAPAYNSRVLTEKSASADQHATMADDGCCSV